MSYISFFRFQSSKFTSPQKISERLSSLVNYIEAVSFPGFPSDQGLPTLDPRIHGKFYHMSSFGERKTLKYIYDSETSLDFVKYNSRQLSRIYPSATRQDSSNLDPLLPWTTGCQMGKLIRF